MRIFLTGGSGFLGGQLVRTMAARGHQLTLLVRNPAAYTPPPGARVVCGSVEKTESYRPELPGHDGFVHVAALVKMWVRDRSMFDRTNVEATEQAILAASDAKIPKFVYASSFMALGPSDGEPIRENDRRRSMHFHNDYERTKYLADQMVRGYIDKGYPVYALYPGVIYGPGALTAGNIVAKSILPFLKGRLPFGVPIRSWSYSYVEDVVDGFVKTIEGKPPSRRYILGGDNKDGAEFYRALSEASGKKPPAINLPLPLARIAGYSEYLLAVLFGREPSLLTHEVVNVYEHSWAYDSTLACTELGYQIRPLKEGLASMIAWMKNTGLIR